MSLPACHNGLDRVQPVARHYGFLEVDERSYMLKKIDAREFAWKDIAGDLIHPDPQGRAIYAEAVTALLEQQARLGDTPTPAPSVQRPFFGDEFTTATLLPIAAARVSTDWRVVAASRMVRQVSGRNVLRPTVPARP